MYMIYDYMLHDICIRNGLDRNTSIIFDPTQLSIDDTNLQNPDPSNFAESMIFANTKKMNK